MTIPQEVVKFLELEPEDRVAFIYDPKTKHITIDKINKITTPSGLSFSISKEMAKKLLKEEGEDGRKPTR